MLNLEKTEALLYFDRFCPGLCGGGEYVLMRKANGVWHVVDRYGSWCREESLPPNFGGYGAHQELHVIAR